MSGLSKLRDDDHGGGRADVRKEFAVHAADGFPIFHVGQVHAGANHVIRMMLRPRRELPAIAKMRRVCACGVEVIRADGPGPGKMNGVPHAHRARKADDRLVGRSAADVLAHGNQGSGFSDQASGAGIRDECERLD